MGAGFRLQRLNDFYYAWSATAADVNRDGVLDVVAGPHYFLGPDYRVSREIYVSRIYNPGTEYAGAAMNIAHDYTGDGFPGRRRVRGPQLRDVRESRQRTAAVGSLSRLRQHRRGGGVP